jgi:acetyltransferase-like isoleucine patch superfamily enzyme
VSVLRHALAALAVARARLGVCLWTALAYLRLRAHGASIGPGLRVHGPLKLHCHATGSIRIGERCRIQSGFAGNPVGGGSRMSIWVGKEGCLRLGDRVGLSNSTIVCMRSVVIEDDVFLGGGCRIYDTDFHSVRAQERGAPGNPGTRTAPVQVRRRAFVGGHSTLLKGVTIGEEAVVGACSVVRSDVPDGQVWAGNPAAFVRDLQAPRRPVAVEPREAVR